MRLEISDRITRAACAYHLLTAADLSTWLSEEYADDEIMFDPVAAYLEAEFPGLNVRSGLQDMVLMDGASTFRHPLHAWHDLLLAQVSNGMVSENGDLHGFFNCQDGHSGASVEALRKLLGPRPVSPVVRLLRTVSTALKTAFTR